MVIRTKKWTAYVDKLVGDTTKLNEIRTDFAFVMRDINSIESYHGEHFEDAVNELVEIEKDFDKIVIEGNFENLFVKFKKSRERPIGGIFN